MSVRNIAAIVAAVHLMGCAHGAAESEAESMDLALARVEKQCGVASGTLTLGADNYVKFKPAADEKYERIDCIIRKLKRPQFADHIKLGFVGNEAIAEENK